MLPRAVLYGVFRAVQHWRSADAEGGPPQRGVSRHLVANLRASGRRAVLLVVGKELELFEGSSHDLGRALRA